MINQHVAVEQSQGPVTATCDVDPACCSGQDQSRGPVTAISDVARVVAGARIGDEVPNDPKASTETLI